MVVNGYLCAWFITKEKKNNHYFYEDLCVKTFHSPTSFLFWCMMYGCLILNYDWAIQLIWHIRNKGSKCRLIEVFCLVTNTQMSSKKSNLWDPYLVKWSHEQLWQHFVFCHMKVVCCCICHQCDRTIIGSCHGISREYSKLYKLRRSCQPCC